MKMITDIYRVNFMKDKFSYVGLLRNEKKFNIGDNVWFSANSHNIAYGKIVGVELPPEMNPSYTYKITIPENLIYEKMNHDDFYSGINLDKVTLDCEDIFSTIDEAKASALMNLDRMYKLQKKQIDIYFKQFK